MIRRVSTGPLLAGTLCLLATAAYAQQQMAPPQAPAAPAPAATPMQAPAAAPATAPAPAPAAAAPAAPAAAALPPGSPLIGRPADNAAAAKLAPVPAPPLATAADKIPLDQLKVPKGFNIELYASGMPNARSLALGPKGTVFVGSRLQDKVYAITDKDGKRQAKVLLSGLYRPNGVVVHDGTLYIAELSQISKIDNVEDKLDSSPKPVVFYKDLPKTRRTAGSLSPSAQTTSSIFRLGSRATTCCMTPIMARSAASTSTAPAGKRSLSVCAIRSALTGIR